MLIHPGHTGLAPEEHRNTQECKTSKQGERHMRNKARNIVSCFLSHATGTQCITTSSVTTCHNKANTSGIKADFTTKSPHNEEENDQREAEVCYFNHESRAIYTATVSM
jgi:hypothetical protein